MTRMNVPDAETLVRLMSAWSNLPKHKFHRAYPFFDADRQRMFDEYGLGKESTDLEATALLFAEYADDIFAQGIEARRAGTTKIGPVADESPVAVGDAPTPGVTTAQYGERK